eukprot:6963954-Pyramimonas_sp.AAC.1
MTARKERGPVYKSIFRLKLLPYAANRNLGKRISRIDGRRLSTLKKTSTVGWWFLLQHGPA